MTLGPYRLDRKIGSRSVHTDYDAYGPRKGQEPGRVRLVATALGDEVPSSVQERFRDEAGALLGLEQENVLAALGWGLEGGTAFVAVEPYDAERLDALIAADGRLDPQAVAVVGLDVASALIEAHRSPTPLLHRAIAPKEILVDGKGRVRLDGFAAASFVLAMGSLHSQLLELSCGYQSPESLEAKTVGPPSDLFALGATLYEALAGQPAFAGATPLQIALKVSTVSFTPLPEIVEGVDPNLADFVHSLMNKDPALRPDARATRDALWDWLGRSDEPRRAWGLRLRPPPAPAQRPPRPRPDTLLDDSPREPASQRKTAKLSLDTIDESAFRAEPTEEELNTDLIPLPQEMLPTPTIVQPDPTFASYDHVDEAATVAIAATALIELPSYPKTAVLPETQRRLNQSWDAATVAATGAATGALSSRPPVRSAARPTGSGPGMASPDEMSLALKVAIGAFVVIIAVTASLFLAIWLSG